MKTLLFFIAGLLASQAGRAQYYVYHVSGTVYLQSLPKPMPLLAHAAVQPGQALLLRPGAQVILLDQAGHNVVYTKPGVASYAALQQAFAASAAGPGRAYLAYVWGRLHHHEAAPAQQRSAPLGGVARGEVVPLLAPADSAVVQTPLVAFQWQAPAATTPLWFTLTDGTGDPLLQLRLAAPALDLSAQLSRLKPNTLYYWAVSTTAEAAANAPRRAFVLADTDSQDAFAQELAGLPAAPEAAWQQAFQQHWFLARAKRR